ncbi:MAG: L,D-transpeptidase family protein [Candidatus Dadabacteria bacterium]|nr:L,D-transpeptidase family protein [Candidatus Dadabacteria bacterium]
MNRLIRIKNQKLSVFISTVAVICLFVLSCAAPNQENMVKEVEKPSPQTQNFSTAKVSQVTRQKIRGSKYAPKILIQTKNIKAYKTLPKLYEERNYVPLWIENGRPSSQAYEMIEIIRNSDNEALDPDYYNISEIESILKRIEQDRYSGDSYEALDLAELELLLSNSFLTYTHDLHYGRVRAEQINLELFSGERPVNLPKLLVTAIETDQVQGTLEGLLPKYPMYAKLRISLKEYREIAAKGGWQPVAYGDKFKKGARGQRVLALSKRLKVTGELDSSTPGREVFDDSLDQAVRKYQQRNGLYVDGVVGESTIEALNVPVEERISQIELTMERWRLLPQYLGNRYILVNIANYHLYGVENNNDTINMRIVVGKPQWNTPMFSEEMTHLIINPYWNIPPSIFKDDIVPRIKEDSEYMSKLSIDALGLKAPEKIVVEEAEVVEVVENVEATEVTDGDNTGEQELSEVEIQNKKAQEEYIAKVLSGKYRLRQNPGPGNPLGRIKFLFPNKHSIYLHDTPNRGFFKKAQRNFSHGCIRVEKPLELAEFVLSSNPSWTQDTIQSSINKMKTKTVHLDEAITVYILYFTTWVDNEGYVNFHKDIYGLDKTLYNALRTTRPQVDMATMQH